MFKETLLGAALVLAANVQPNITESGIESQDVDAVEVAGRCWWCHPGGDGGPWDLREDVEAMELAGLSPLSIDAPRRLV